MSQVISFRLDRNNPREAQALYVLTKWREEGYSLRHMLTEALIAVEKGGKKRDDEKLAQLMSAVQEIAVMLEGYQGMPPPARQPVAPKKPTLSEDFVSAIKTNAKRGITLD
jgi:hypothetical protein